MRPLDRSVGSKKQRPEGDAPNAASSVVVPLLKLIFAEADLLRASMVVFQKASESVVIQFLIDGVWHERDRVPLRHWRPIVEYLKSLAMKGNRRDEIWVGEFSRDNCKEFLASGSIGTRMEPSQSISIRIEGDERIEVQFSRQG